MCSMLCIYDKRKNTQIAVSVNKNLDDLPLHILSKYIEELFYLQKVNASNGIKTNVRERVIKLINSMPYFGGMSDEIEILEEDKMLKMTLRGGYAFEAKEIPKICCYIEWIKSLFKPKPTKLKMATKLRK